MREDAADSRERFARCWLDAEPAVRAFVFAAIRGFQDAEDVVQQTALVAARRFDEYDPARPFVAWSLWLARSRVIEHYRSQGRRRAVFSDALLDRVATAIVARHPSAHGHAAALERCLEKLPARSRRLLDLRYAEDASTESIARAVDSTAGAVRVALFRIRALLADCIRGELGRVPAVDRLAEDLP
jgi:RNA polymerase sigma-70 factor (ECF subfamily)